MKNNLNSSSAPPGSIEAKLLEMEANRTVNSAYNEKMFEPDNIEIPAKSGVNIGYVNIYCLFLN